MTSAACSLLTPTAVRLSPSQPPTARIAAITSSPTARPPRAATPRPLTCHWCPQHLSQNYSTALGGADSNERAWPERDHGLASYSGPITLYTMLDRELGTAGVEPGLLPTLYIFSGPPSEIPFHIPRPPEGPPEIGVWPMQKAGPAIRAYREALDRIDPDLRYELSELIEALDGSYDWHGKQGIRWWRKDTSIFVVVG
ncbi:DUF7691 family protein [Streptomyces sp. st140]|uniref:DUF7691 family protein n=1 Tax=Streptomyces sp. st140 TaxID=1828052 RepID=UPI003F9056EF